jgi:hypothetical protein
MVSFSTGTQELTFTRTESTLIVSGSENPSLTYYW